MNGYIKVVCIVLYSIRLIVGLYCHLTCRMTSDGLQELNDMKFCLNYLR